MRVVTIILGVLLVISGIYCIMTPVAAYSALGWVIGASMIIEGVGSVILWNRFRKMGLANGWTLAEAILAIVLGVFLVGSYMLQAAVDLFIAYLIAIWLVFSGITRIVVAIAVRNGQGKEAARGWILQVVLGVLVVICGVLCIFNPLSIMAGVGLMLGISVILVGVGLIAGSSEI